MSDYPEHDAFVRVRNESQSIVDFIEWWAEKRSSAPRDERGLRVPLWDLTERQKERLIADYYNIDLDVFHEEKEAIVQEMAAQQEGLPND